MTLPTGQEAPDFELVGTLSEPFKLSGLRGQKNAVLAFFELAFNDDCTAEMQAFQELLPQFEDADAQVLGISIDPVGIAGVFASSYDLGFPLLSDIFGHEVCLLYDAWRDDRGFASEHGGIARRVTYVIDKQTIIRGVVENVADVRDHSQEALRLAKALEAS